MTDTSITVFPNGIQVGDVIITSTGYNGPIGQTTPNVGTFTTLVSTGGALNGTIGATTPAAGTFTALSSTSGALNGTLGATTPAAITGTTITASTELRGTVLTSNSTSAVAVKTSGGTQANFAHVASAVNYIQTSGAAVGGSPRTDTIGDDTNIGRLTVNKGTGPHRFFSDGGASELFRVSHTASAVEYLQATGAASGGSPTLSAQGSGANLGITLANKGTAVTKLTGQTVQTTVGAAGGASALPATPTGYIVVGINGTDRVIPYYATA